MLRLARAGLRSFASAAAPAGSTAEAFRDSYLTWPRAWGLGVTTLGLGAGVVEYLLQPLRSDLEALRKGSTTLLATSLDHSEQLKRQSLQLSERGLQLSEQGVQLSQLTATLEDIQKKLA